MTYSPTLILLPVNCHSRPAAPESLWGNPGKSSSGRLPPMKDGRPHEPRRLRSVALHRVLLEHLAIEMFEDGGAEAPDLADLRHLEKTAAASRGEVISEPKEHA